jgi:hydroxyethylthiazole kinase-like uncharacterized protein yjeF
VILVTSKQMRELDRRTIEHLGIPGAVLMDHAGRSLAERVRARGPRRTVLLCGKGNNGGDGWSAARWLHQWGYSVQVVTLAVPDSLRGDAALMAQAAIRSGVPFDVWEGGPLPDANVYVDALLGTGASRPPEGAMQSLIEAVNASGATVVACDVPTGVDADTGRVPGVAVQAVETVTMGAPKLGLCVTPGALYAGRWTVADVGIPLDPDTVAAHGPMCEWVNADWARSRLPRRVPDSHKGTYGRVGVLCGQMQGASVLAALGAARAGAGWVALLHPPAAAPSAPPEFVLRAVTPAEFAAAAQPLDVVVAGPGLGTAAPEWVEALRGFPGPAVIDAEALAVFDGGALPGRPWVITPHPKEAARLLRWSVSQVQAERVAAARALAERTGVVAVLKGYRTLVAAPDGRLRVIGSGDASLATAGTGDVLAGVIGALLAQGLAPYDAAALGAWLHGRAGELAGEALSMASVMASDVVEQISRVLRHCFETHPGDSDR